MKFTNGYWLNREEYDVNSPKETYDAQQNGKTITAFAPYKRIMSRGDQLNLGATTITLTSPVENVIGVKLEHFDTNEHGPEFKINNLDPEVAIEVNDQVASLQSGDLKVTLPLRTDFEMKFTANGQLVTQSETNAQATIWNHDTKVNYMREQLSMGIDEKSMASVNASLISSRMAKLLILGTKMVERVVNKRIKIFRFTSVVTAMGSL